MDIKYLKEKARNIRKNIIRMTYESGVNGGHIGGGLSSADVLSVLYGAIMNIDKDNMEDVNRDRFILSKGHTAIAHYAALCEYGFISEEEMFSFEKDGTAFPTHEVKNVSKGIEISSGSLGYGASVGTGIALNAKRKGLGYKTYVLMGDGEINEGSNYEAMMSASRFGLDNIVFLVDYNKQQLDGFTSKVMPVADMEKAFEGMGCLVRKIDGNNIEEIVNVLKEENSSGKPLAVILDTVKGKGIKEIEGQPGWHHVHLSEEVYLRFMEALEEE